MVVWFARRLRTLRRRVCPWATFTLVASLGVGCLWAERSLAQDLVEEGEPQVTGSPAAASVPPSATPECPLGDSDGDKICDDLERRTGTKPLRADTDGDGVLDGVEDANLDGVVNEGESDPRVPGLFPGSYPHIPEPMVFDLVRGLGAKRGEVEFNSLNTLEFRGGRPTLLWAPEVEWAFWDGLAVEIELPMHERHLEALKSAFQATLPSPARNFTHGLQVIGEYLLSSRDLESVVLYLVAGRIQQWSMLVMAGARGTTPMRATRHYDVLLNPSIYNDLTESLTLGIESNLELLGGTRRTATLTPQVHWQVSRSFRVQLGAGASFADGQTTPQVITRVIYED